MSQVAFFVEDEIFSINTRLLESEEVRGTPLECLRNATDNNDIIELKCSKEQIKVLLLYLQSTHPIQQTVAINLLKSHIPLHAIMKYLQYSTVTEVYDHIAHSDELEVLLSLFDAKKEHKEVIINHIKMNMNQYSADIIHTTFSYYKYEMDVVDLFLEIFQDKQNTNIFYMYDLRELMKYDVEKKLVQVFQIALRNDSFSSCPPDVLREIENKYNLTYKSYSDLYFNGIRGKMSIGIPLRKCSACTALIVIPTLSIGNKVFCPNCYAEMINEIPSLKHIHQHHLHLYESGCLNTEPIRCSECKYTIADKEMCYKCFECTGKSFCNYYICKKCVTLTNVNSIESTTLKNCGVVQNEMVLLSTQSLIDLPLTMIKTSDCFLFETNENVFSYFIKKYRYFPSSENKTMLFINTITNNHLRKAFSYLAGRNTLIMNFVKNSLTKKSNVVDIKEYSPLRLLQIIPLFHCIIAIIHSIADFNIVEDILLNMLFSNGEALLYLCPNVLERFRVFVAHIHDFEITEYDCNWYEKGKMIKLIRKEL